MHYRGLKTARTTGFHTDAVYRKAVPRAATAAYLREKSSFFIAAIAMVAFLGGNMVGQHGWYAFWKSVFGAVDDSLIEYTGMMTPVEFVPDYTRWSAYGGGDGNTFRQVPKDLLISLPPYDASVLLGDGARHAHVYSVGYMGSYATGGDGDGSHPGVDIRMPEGTPIRSIANGIVTRVGNDRYGFGNFIVIRHPHVPDPANPGKTTVVFSAYAHLSASYVAEGDIVTKGLEIGLSGSTGDSSGPHLHFQIDRDTAPWHPYWPFSVNDARQAGLSTLQAINTGFGKENGFAHTLSPLVFIQSKGALGSNLAASPSALTAQATPRRSLSERVALRKNRRTVAAAPVVVKQTIAAVLEPEERPALPVTDAPPPAPQAQPKPQPSGVQTGTVATVEIEHDGAFSGREWETVSIVLRNAAGVVVQPDSLERDLVLRTAFGEAEFRPQTVSSVDFVGGVAQVKMLPRGRRTVVIQVQPAGAISAPMRFDER